MFDTTDPFDASPELLVDLKNGYIPDAANRSGVYARPGFVLQNAAAPLVSSGSPVAGQGVHTHPMLDGSTLNFCVVQGRLLRVANGFGTITDVTPVGITIDSNPLTHVYFVSDVGQLIVNDGVNRPWVGTNLTATPITGTYIDYDGAGVAWTAFGQPVVKDGAVLMILKTVGGVSRRADFSWSAPGDALTGWQQPNYDYNWTLSTNDADALFALVATNLALYYFREASIGTASGTVGPDFRSTATQDSVSFNVGARVSRSIQKFGDAIYFCDAQGRPYRLVSGSPPQPIWKQARAVVDAARTDVEGATDLVLVSAIERTLNLYVVGAWSPNPEATSRPTSLLVFDAATGGYLGRWTIFDYGPAAPGSSQGIPIEALGPMVDQNGVARLAVLGGLDGAVTTTQGGYLWVLSTAADARQQPGHWLDNGVFPDRAATTDRMGFAEDVVYNIDRVTVIAGNAAPCQISVTTPNAINTLEATPSPNAGAVDGTYRLIAGCELQGRGCSVTVRPTTGTEQWILQRVALSAVAATASPEDR